MISKRFTDLCEKIPIDIKIAAQAILIDHAYKNLYSKKDMIEVSLDLPPDALELLKKASKTLKISSNSLLVAYIQDYLKTQEEDLTG